MDLIVDRILLILKKKNQTASKFADEIGVQRSSMSHILSGRNKPSLDFILKILGKYPEINAEWLLKGKGKYTGEVTLFDEQLNTDEAERKIAAKTTDLTGVSTEKAEETALKHQKIRKGEIIGKSVDKIVIFYNDQTFQEFRPG
jgi:transcriptional regulator with XRE-family HTH domain